MAAIYKSLVVLLAALPVAACGYDNGHAYRNGNYYGNGSTQCGSVVHSAIDANALIDADPGTGAGMLVEYAEGGHWHVRTICDTNSTGTSCAWDLLVTPESGAVFGAVTPEELEPEDVVSFQSDALRFTTVTGADSDGLFFDIDPGAEAEFDALLDGSCATRFFFWFGDGAQHNGAPSNPIWLTPSAP